MPEERRRVRVDDDTKGSKGRTVEIPSFGPGQPSSAASAVDDESCRCPRLDRADWHEIESDWSDITFLQSAIGAPLGVPVGYGRARQKLEMRAQALGATIPEDAMVLLGQGRLRRPLMLEVEPPALGARGLHRPGGVAFSRMVDAPLGQMKRLTEETAAAATRRYGRPPDDLWVWYLTCRTCSSARDYETLIIAHYRGQGTGNRG